MIAFSSYGLMSLTNVNHLRIYYFMYMFLINNKIRIHLRHIFLSANVLTFLNLNHIYQYTLSFIDNIYMCYIAWGTYWYNSLINYVIYLLKLAWAVTFDQCIMICSCWQEMSQATEQICSTTVPYSVQYLHPCIWIVNTRSFICWVHSILLTSPTTVYNRAIIPANGHYHWPLLPATSVHSVHSQV